MLKSLNEKVLFILHQIPASRYWTWATATYRDSSHTAGLIFSEGNLVIMDDTDGEIWSSGTAGQGYLHVTLTDEGKLALIKADGTVVEIPSPA